jgi:peptidoglycan/xylan/chitin deacetylase (PgdA/CDA1 family)
LKNNKISIVMYHYVRDLKHSAYPEIKALTTYHFKQQIEFIANFYNIVRPDELLNCVDSGSGLPPKALLLTFDDGYIDHFKNVYPILKKESISGCFFPSAMCITENKVLDVNKIHFVLASVSNPEIIVNYIFDMLDEFGRHLKIRDKIYYWDNFAIADHLDSKAVVFIKGILQRHMPEELRRQMIDRLFNKFVSEDETTFAKKLYMDIDQIMQMKRDGMYIGSHGYNHDWLNTLDHKEQEREVRLSMEFLKTIGCDLDKWIMSYPYGGFNDSLISILKKNGCKIGLTTEVGIADLYEDDPLKLPRLDTNDLPKNRNAVPNRWTLQALK